MPQDGKAEMQMKELEMEIAELKAHNKELQVTI